MSILLHHQIKKEITAGNIVYSGESLNNVGPNSVDVTLHKTLKTYVPCKIVECFKNEKYHKKIVLDVDELKSMINSNDINDFFIDVAEKNSVFEYEIPEEGLILSKDILYLGATIEACGSEKFIPIYEGRSSIARLGIQSHISAGFGDINFKSNWTLEITCVHNAKVYPGMRIGQVYFVETDDDARELLFAEKMQYDSKYSDQTIAQESKSYLDFKNGECISRS